MKSVKIPAVAGLLSLSIACYPAATQLEIPYEKYTLDNGLDVVLHEDHSDPIVALSIVVHVGSSRERPGKTGFAHFFEHMSFNDSENVPRGANRKMIAELGGTRNGGTWTDGTIYYEVVPKDAFEKLLWIDSDRLGYMINTVTAWALENEKQVVKNEKRQRVDNRAYGHTREVILANLYPPDHPYNWPVIGSLEDLQDATLDDVREFYDRYYGPNNATLVIVGDIDVEQTKSLVGKWFGEIKRGPDVPPPQPMPVSLERTRSVYHEDNLAQVPELRMTFPTVEEFHPDSYALEALGEILSDGKRAQLYRVIVEEQKLAPDAAAYNSSSELAGTFTIRVRANAGVDLDEVKAAIEAALMRFEEKGFEDKDLARIKSVQETNFYDGISSVLGKAFQLAQYNEYAGDPGYVGEEIERILNITREDVIGVYNRYIKDKPYVMTSFVPKGSKQLIVEGGTRADVVVEQIVQGAEKAVAEDPDFEYEMTDTEHDRSEPRLGEPPLLKLPEIWSAEADNGVRILGIEHDELPLFELSLRLQGGHRLDPPGKEGVSSLLAQLMMEGTKSRTPEELEDAIGELGADISINAGREVIDLSAAGLARNYTEVLALVQEMLFEPRWDAKEFERLKSAMLTTIQQREGDPQQIARNAFFRVLYGDKHIFAVPVDGTYESVSSIGLDDLKAYFEKNFSPSVAAFHFAGAIGRDRITASLDRLGSAWEPKEVGFPEFALPEQPTKPAVYFIDVPGTKQSVILVGRLALRGDDEDYNDLVYANNRLGSGSSARLFQLLRIEKGYTYGASSGVARRQDASAFVASSSVRANVTLESLQLFRELLQGYHDTFTDEDLRTTKNLLVKKATRDFETLGDLLDVLEDITTYELPLDFVGRDQRELRALTLDDVRATIAKYIDESRMAYVIVGDGETQLGRISGLGYGDPILLDIDGSPLVRRAGL